ncbi:MAG: hypothetical protein WEA04_02265 [Candidatus Andersenbacteria bacterium]
MYLDYFYWHYVSGPQWLATFFINMQRVLWQFFSVEIMVKTLFAYWRKDKVSLRASTLSDIGLALAWNMISRVIGFIVRGTVLAAWLITAIVFVGVTLVVLIVFLLAPVVIIIAAAAGLALVLQG